MNKCRWIAVAGAAVVLLPLALVRRRIQVLHRSLTSRVRYRRPDRSQRLGRVRCARRWALLELEAAVGGPGVSAHATEDGIADVMLGRLAVEKGGLDVKTLAQKMVDDHTAINKDMATVADALGVLLPKKMNKDDQAEYDKLNGLAAGLDTEYIISLPRHTGITCTTSTWRPRWRPILGWRGGSEGHGVMRDHLGQIAKWLRRMGSRCLRVRHDRAGLLGSTTTSCGEAVGSLQNMERGLWALFFVRGGADGRDIRAGRSAVRENRGSYAPFVRCLIAVRSPLPLPSPGADWCVSGLLCGGPRDNTIMDILGASGFESVGYAGCGCHNIDCVEVAAKDSDIRVRGDFLKV